MARLGIPALALLSAAVLGGCTTAPQWDKPGATPDSVATDLQACHLAAPPPPAHRPAQGPRAKPGVLIDTQSMHERNIESARVDDRFVNDCMRAKGYADKAR